jgi:hypothetical protein
MCTQSVRSRLSSALRSRRNAFLLIPIVAACSDTPTHPAETVDPPADAVWAASTASCSVARPPRWSLSNPDPSACHLAIREQLGGYIDARASAAAAIDDAFTRLIPAQKEVLYRGLVRCGMVAATIAALRSGRIQPSGAIGALAIQAGLSQVSSCATAILTAAFNAARIRLTLVTAVSRWVVASVGVVAAEGALRSFYASVNASSRLTLRATVSTSRNTGSFSGACPQPTGNVTLYVQSGKNRVKEYLVACQNGSWSRASVPMARSDNYGAYAIFQLSTRSIVVSHPFPRGL